MKFPCLSSLQPKPKKYLCTFIIFLTLIFISLSTVSRSDSSRHTSGKTTNRKAITISSPYHLKRNVYKGQLHIHTTNSDGKNSPQDVINAYKRANYNFIAITDHNKITTAHVSDGNFLVIQGEEIGFAKHILGIGLKKVINPVDVHQILNDINVQSGIAIIPHPNRDGDLFSEKDFRDANNYHGIEIFNGVEVPHNNAEDKFNYALSTLGVKVLGFATDDCHDITSRYFNIAYIYLFADDLTVEEIMKSLREGNFYSSTGAVILSLTISDGNILVSTDAKSRIEFVGFNGQSQKTVSNVRKATYSPTINDVYIYIRITRNSDGKMAWSNPLYVIRK